MKIEIVPSNSNLPLREGWKRLTEKDFNHYESFFAKHPDIQPESIEEIYTRGVFEKYKYPLIILRHIDWMLKINGVFIIDTCSIGGHWCGPYRPEMILRHFIAIAFTDKYILTKDDRQQTYLHLKYQKKVSTLPKDDTIEKWTWGICSNGTKNDRVMEMIQQINSLQIPSCEIIVCGPYPSNNLPSNVRVLDDSPIYTEDDTRIPITKKKNLIAENATYNNLVILHDRFHIPSSWYQSMLRYGNYFDLLLTPVKVIDNLAHHTFDWQNGDYYNLDNPINQDIEERLPYSAYNEHVFVNGGILICKKHIYNEIKQSYKLNWGEMEDADFSQRLTRSGYLVHLDINNYIVSTTLRMHSLGPAELYRSKPSILQRIITNKNYYRHFHESKVKYSKFAVVEEKYDIVMDFRYWFYRILWWFCKHFVKE